MLTYRAGVCSVLVLGAVRSVAERFLAVRELTHVWLLTSVRAQLRLQVLQSAVGLVAILELRNRVGEAFRIHHAYFEVE